MKTLLYILLFNVSALCVAQDPQLFENDWYLYAVQATDLDTEYIVSEIEPSIFPFFIINENLEFNGEGACNSFTGLYEYFPSTNEMSAIDFMETGKDCGLQLHNSFESSYFAFISGGFGYSVMQDGTGLVLNLTIGLFGYATFKNYPLSISDISKNKFQLYPNPVKDKLHLSSKTETNNLKIKTYTIAGKLLSTQNITLAKQASVDVSSLSNGIYFLHIEDGTRNIEVKKFIKK